MGGFARRANYLKAFKQANPKVPVLQVDTGAIFAERSPEENLVNKTMLGGTKIFKTDVINLSTEDLYYVPIMNQPQPVDQSNGEGYLGFPFISANIRSKSSQIPHPAPYVIKTVSGPTLAKTKGVRIGFIGLADNDKYTYPFNLFEVADPLAVAKKLVPEVKAKSDLVVVLADMSREKAAKLAMQNNDIDVIVTGYRYTVPGPPEKVNNATIIVPAYQGRYLGELRVYMNAKGEFERYQNRLVILDAGIPDDPQASDLVVRARAEISNLQKSLAAAHKASRPAKEVYVGSVRCASCHSEAYAVWKQTRHAQALNTLKVKNQEFNPQCLACHNTGYGKEGGFVNSMQTPQFANVQCEQCHGPGLEHVQNPRRGYGRVGEQGCAGCHTSIDSPDFEFAKFWPKIKH